MSVEITYVERFLVKGFSLLKLLLVASGFGSQTFICEFSRQNICSVVSTIVFLNLEIQRSQYIRPKYINVWKLFKGGNYKRK